MKRSSRFRFAPALLAGAVAVMGCGLLTPIFAQTTAPPAATANLALSGEYNVRAFGARGDGKALDTDAINRAMATASAAGGGTVLVPAGTYPCLSLHLKSNIRLHLDAGAVLLAAERTETQRYDAPEPNASTKFQDFGHSHWQDGFLWGENLENLTIDGPGEIYGKGLVKGDSKLEGTGNKAIALKNCRNVNFSDFTIRHGGWFGILATGVDNFTLDNLKIDTNRDGMDIDCCRNVRLSNCSINSPNDDGLCLKSSYGLNEARATENVTITNCFVSGYDEGTVLDGTRQYHPERAPSGSPQGRIKFGTESNGGFKNITISNCIFDHCRGLALETVDGGLLEDVTISNITMRDISNAPIYLRLGRRMRGPDGAAVGELRRVNISNIVAYNVDPKSCVIISGIPDHHIEDVTLSNIQIWYQGGGTAEQANLVPKEDERGYPEPEFLGIMPAYGFYLRHIKGITLDNIQLHTLSADARPPLALSDVVGAEFFRVKADKAEQTPVFAIKDSSDLTIRMVKGAQDKEQKELYQDNF